VKIEKYKFGSIVIEGRKYTSDVIIYPDRVDDSWWRKEGHSLCPEDLEGPLAASPEVLIIGRGKVGIMRIPEETRRFIESKGIELIALRTGPACEEYNKLSARKKVVAGLHLTC
jgi:hypothetical protein